MSILLKPELLTGALIKFGGEDRINLLRAYHGACLDAGCPKSDELTQRIVAIAAGLNQKETTAVGELNEQELALCTTLRLGLDPFKGIPLALQAPGTSGADASVTIPASYVGKKYG